VEFCEIGGGGTVAVGDEKAVQVCIEEEIREVYIRRY
jgi:hypothetical protein